MQFLFSGKRVSFTISLHFKSRSIKKRDMIYHLNKFICVKTISLLLRHWKILLTKTDIYNMIDIPKEETSCECLFRTNIKLSLLHLLINIRGEKGGIDKLENREKKFQEF